MRGLNFIILTPIAHLSVSLISPARSSSLKLGHLITDAPQVILSLCQWSCTKCFAVNFKLNWNWEMTRNDIWELEILDLYFEHFKVLMASLLGDCTWFAVDYLPSKLSEAGAKSYYIQYPLTSGRMSRYSNYMVAFICKTLKQRQKSLQILNISLLTPTNIAEAIWRYGDI